MDNKDNYYYEPRYVNIPYTDDITYCATDCERACARNLRYVMVPASTPYSISKLDEVCSMYSQPADYS